VRLVDRLGALVEGRDPSRVIPRQIGVILLHELPVGSLDHLGIGIGVHLQHRVVVVPG
jgi:hypothetical protein